MLRVAAILSCLEAAAWADPIAACPVEKPITAGQRIAADLKTTYAIAGEDVRVCVDRADYPYGGPGKGHRMMACLVVANGKHAERFCGGGNSISIERHRRRFTVSLRTPRHGASVDVWLQVDRVP